MLVVNKHMTQILFATSAQIEYGRVVDPILFILLWWQTTIQPTYGTVMNNEAERTKPCVVLKTISSLLDTNKTLSHSIFSKFIIKYRDPWLYNVLIISDWNEILYLYFPCKNIVLSNPFYEKDSQQTVEWLEHNFIINMSELWTSTRPVLFQTQVVTIFLLMWIILWWC